jgi:hypothetical protein
MGHTHGGCVTTKSSHQATSSAQRIFFTRVLLAQLTSVVELSLCTGMSLSLGTESTVPVCMGSMWNLQKASSKDARECRV